MNADRKYLLMTSKHTDKLYPLFWGRLTEDDTPRSFGDYTEIPDHAEHYTMDEIIREFADPIELVPALPIRTIFGRVVRFSSEDWWKHRNEGDLFVIKVDEIREVIQGIS